MNSLSAFVVLGMIFIAIPMIAVPVANIASGISDQSCTQGFTCFFLGNLGFFEMFFLIITVFWWMFIS